MPISFDIPALNIANPNIPVTIFLSEQEVQILVRSVPNIKVVPVITVEPVQRTEKKKELLVEKEPVVEPTVEPTTVETITEPPVAPVEEAQKSTAEIIVKKSNTLSLSECKAMIKTLNSVEELKAFLSSDETRVTVKEAVESRIKELQA